MVGTDSQRRVQEYYQRLYGERKVLKMGKSTQVRGRVALVHDWLNQLGGAENVLEELVGMLPGAPIYTSIYAPERMPSRYRSWDIHTSFMQRLPGVTSHHQKYLAFYPLAFQRMDLSGFDLVLSNKSGFCHGVRTRPSTSRRSTSVTHTYAFLWQYDLYRQREQIGCRAP